MRKGFLGSLAVLAAGAGLTFGQQFNPPPGAMPGTLPPPGMTTGNPPPGVAPGAYAGPSGQGGGYTYATPDGNPMIMPPGLEGMVPPGSMGAGAPGGAYEQPKGGFGSGRGVISGLLGNGGGPPRIWFGAEYMLWVPKSARVGYPLATTSAPIDLGVLGQPTTVALSGADRDIGFDMENGLRATIGLAFDESMGIEASGMAFAKRTQSNFYPSNTAGVPLLAVPFYDANAQVQGSYIVAFPGINSGSIKIDNSTRAIGAELNGVFRLYQTENGPGGLTLLAGARFFQLQETFSEYTTSSTFGVPPTSPLLPNLPSSFFPAAGGAFAGTIFGAAPYTVVTSDVVRTHNNFFGANVGFRGDIGYGNWVLGLNGQVAAGIMQQWADVVGYSTLTTSTNVVNTQPGGLFNLPNDLGRHNKNRFAILPEGGVTLGYQLFSWLRVTGGYSYLWTNSVVRPTSSITPILNPNLIPVSPTYNGTAPAMFQPRDTVKDGDYHLHGFTAGLQFSF